MEGEILQPIEEPQAIKHIHGFGDIKGIIVTQTIHGSVYEDKDKPRYIQYHVSKLRENIPDSPDDIISVKNSSIINEDEDQHTIERKEILAWAEGYWMGRKESGCEDDEK